MDEYTDKTLPVPPAVIVNRLRALAHESLKVLEERILHPEYDWKVLCNIEIIETVRLGGDGILC